MQRYGILRPILTTAYFEEGLAVLQYPPIQWIAEIMPPNEFVDANCTPRNKKYSRTTLVRKGAVDDPVVLPISANKPPTSVPMRTATGPACMYPIKVPCTDSRVL